MPSFSSWGTVTTWAPLLGQVAVLFFVLVLYAKRTKVKNYSRSLYALGLITLVARVIYASFLTLTQYWIWAQHPISAVLLQLPLEKAGDLSFLENRLNYFVFYAFQRYWANIFLSLLLALLFFLFLTALKKYRERFFDTGEIALGTVLCLLVTWPQGFVFIALSFVIVVLLAVFRLLRKKSKFTTLGLPFLLSAILTLTIGNSILISSGLASLAL